MSKVECTTKLNYRSVIKMFWRTIRQIREKKEGGVKQVKFKNGALFSNRKSILCRWREYSSKAENSPSMKEVVLTIKLLKSGQSVGGNEIRLEMLKAVEESIGFLASLKWSGKEVQYRRLVDYNDCAYF